VPEVNLPLSGAVAQVFRFWASLFSPSGGGQVGLVNVNLGRSPAPAVEEEVLAEVGSYGRQLGRIGDALAVLLKDFPPPGRTLSPEEDRAIRDLKRMLDDVADVKERHGIGHVLRP
jgi:hypothetical protein